MVVGRRVVVAAAGGGDTNKILLGSIEQTFPFGFLEGNIQCLFGVATATTTTVTTTTTTLEEARRLLVKHSYHSLVVELTWVESALVRVVVGNLVGFRENGSNEFVSDMHMYAEKIAIIIPTQDGIIITIPC